MSFRRRLWLFFAIIVVVPVVAAALVLIPLAEDSQSGKADARIAAGFRTAFAVYRADADRARAELDRLARDTMLERMLGGRRATGPGQPPVAPPTLAALIRGRPAIRSVELYPEGATAPVRAGTEHTVAPAGLDLREPGGPRIGTLTLSVTSAREHAREVARLTGLHVRIFRAGTPLASTLPEPGPVVYGSSEVEIGGRTYRGRFEGVPQPAGPPVEIGVFQESGGLSAAIAQSRLLIGGLLLLFVLVALLAAMLIVRALQDQVAQFLDAARRIGAGDFSGRVPVEGRDEFAELGEEFNKMSDQLLVKIDEVEDKRNELEETTRRVGDAFAAGLDRRGITDLAVRTAVEACSADAGRTRPLDPREIDETYVGDEDSAIVAALDAAERRALRIGEAEPEIASSVVEDLPPSGDERRVARAEVAGVHALAIVLPARPRAARDEQPWGAGVISVARPGHAFNESERGVFAYLAARAAVSITNANVHETVQLEAVTDELTGLSNFRRFCRALDVEMERVRRFRTPLGLIMIDIDDFKLINDTHGHQQGDVVLVELARLLQRLSREIDEPARYGGEELALLLPQTDLEGARLVAERVRAEIEALEIGRPRGARPLKVTASFGVASVPESASDGSSLLATADAALYRAKREGKNRVEIAETARAPR